MSLRDRGFERSVCLEFVFKALDLVQLSVRAKRVMRLLGQMRFDEGCFMGLSRDFRVFGAYFSSRGTG